MASVVEKDRNEHEPAPKQDANRRLPPLQNGDHLSREEFRRRYEAMPWLKKAELIEGVVYLPSDISSKEGSSLASPVSNRYHGVPHFKLIGWLAFYQAFTLGTEGGDNSSLRLALGDNEPQPDAFLRILAEHVGQSKTSEDGYVVGAPELIGEIAASSVSYDLHSKLRAYQRNGVLEYVVWRVYDEEIDWYVLKEGRFDKLLADADGIYRSRVFPGLWLNPIALVAGNTAEVIGVLQRGIATPEHAEFVGQLQSKRTSVN